jgi:hypothetical protein
MPHLFTVFRGIGKRVVVSPAGLMTAIAFLSSLKSSVAEAVPLAKQRLSTSCDRPCGQGVDVSAVSMQVDCLLLTTPPNVSQGVVQALNTMQQAGIAYA